PFKGRAAVGSPAILPHDGPVQGLPCLPLPDTDRLTLIRDPDREGLGLRLRQGLPAGVQRRRPEILRVVLHPPGSGKVLRNLTIAPPQYPAIVSDDERPGAGGSFVDGQDRFHGANVRVLADTGNGGSIIGL